MRAYCLLTLILMPLFGSSLLRADTIVLVNGDRLTGAIKRLEDGKLVLSAALLGTVRVQWSNIRSIKSESSFSILTVDGERFEGQLSREGARTAVTSDGESVANLESPSIARIVPGIRKRGAGRLLTALEGAADIGYSLARGNQNQMQSSLGARAEYASAHYKFSGRLDSLFARQDGARSQSRHALNTRLERFVNARVFTYGLSAFERNERRRLDLRTRLGGGLGWRLRDSRKTDLSMLGGFAYVHERYRHEPNRTTGEGFVGVEWDTTLFRGIALSTNFTVHPDAFDHRNVRTEFDSTLRVPIAGRFTYSLRLFDRFHTKPAASVERNDYGLVSGVGMRF